MLVLSRKAGEKVILRNKSRVLLELVVVEIRGDKVRLGFTADHEITILREEIAAAFPLDDAGSALLH